MDIPPSGPGRDIRSGRANDDAGDYPDPQVLHERPAVGQKQERDGDRECP
jgi:hypothetical protein